MSKRVRKDSCAAQIYPEISRYFWLSREEIERRTGVTGTRLHGGIQKLRKLGALEMRKKFEAPEYRKTSKEIHIG